MVAGTPVSVWPSVLEVKGVPCVCVGDHKRSRRQEDDSMSLIPECPPREGWKWEEMNPMLCRASMLNGPYVVHWEKGTREWSVIEGRRQMTIFVAGPFRTADSAMKKAERMTVDHKESG